MNSCLILTLYGYQNVPSLTRHIFRQVCMLLYMMFDSIHITAHEIRIKKQMFRKERDLFLQMMVTNFEVV